ncbi:hypothetical protein HT031_003336 [Scenedesmus sp. PABB004]|nr:hypothetical protein HT031_003336 [Scenedesmus sp. PABB004]
MPAGALGAAALRQHQRQQQALRRRVPRAGAGRAEALAPATADSPADHADRVLAALRTHDLEALVPYASELAVIRAVVRQHETQAAWARREAEAEAARGGGGGAPDPYAPWPPPPPAPLCPVPGASGGALDAGDRAWDAARERAGAPAAPPRTGAPAPAGPPEFAAILDAAQSGEEARHLLDSYAMRHLVLSRPAELEPLSGMALGPDAYVQRARSTSLWGEKCVLTVTLKRRSEAELRSGYSRQPHKEPWVIARVAGEPLSGDPLEAISPQHPPEAVVAAQVQAFKDCDFDVAYALTSPVGRAVAGTRERFRAAMQSDYRYEPVLRHAAAASVHRTHSNSSTYLEVFQVTGAAGGSSLFIWVATRQLDGLYKGCWLVEYVTPIRDPDIIKTLQAGF